MTPENPNGINGVQLPGFTYQTPTAINNTTTASLIITIIVFNRVDFLTPCVNNIVIIKTIKIAGTSI